MINKIKLTVFFLLLLSMLSTSAFASSFVVDKETSRIEFSVKHMLIAWVHGVFKTFNGGFDFDPKTKIISNANLKIKVYSISTAHRQRDEELMYPKFFAESKYPYIYFKQNSFKKLKDGTISVTGDLTIKDSTRPVTLTGKYLGSMKNDSGKRIVGFTASLVVKRSDFNLDWDILTKDGEFIIGQDVSIDLRVQGTEK